MARIPYIPFSQTYADLFAFCGIELTPTDFGGKQGWGRDVFAQALDDAKTYLDDNYSDDWTEEEAAAYEAWYNLLDNYEVCYWSVENWDKS